MTTRIKYKGRRSNTNGKLIDEVIEIKDDKFTKYQNQRKKKEPIEYSSEATTTPNKIQKNKSKVDDDVEITEIEISVPSKKKTPANRSISKNSKRGDNKLMASGNDIKVRKINKGDSFTLEESDIDENDNNRKKSTSKVKDRKSSNRRNVSPHDNKKYPKKYPKGSKDNIIEFELSSDESDNEAPKPQAQRKKKSSGTRSCIKATKSTKKVNIEEEPKSRSTIKLAKQKQKMPELLGKKRKMEGGDRSQSKSPYKKCDKTPKRYPPQNKNSDSRRNSKTPKRYSSKRNDMMDIDNSIPNQKNAVTPQLAVIDKLIEEFGLEKVLESLSKKKLNHRNKLDSLLQGLKDSFTDNGINFLLFKILFSYFKDRCDNLEKLVQGKNRSISANKSPGTKSLCKQTKSQRSVVKTPIKKDKTNNVNVVDPNKVYKEEQPPILISEEKAKKQPEKSNTEDNKNSTCIGSHYHKDKDGKIFKYQVGSLDGKGNATFKCYDDNCSGEGLYTIDTKKFKVTKEHNVAHEKHDYIMNIEKTCDKIYKDLMNSKKNDAQVVKENGQRAVKIY